MCCRTVGWAWCAVMVACVGVCGSYASGQVCEAELVGSYGGSAQELVLDGDYAYVAASVAGLRIVDISNPAEPIFLSSLDDNSISSFVGLDVVGDTAYISAFGDGVWIIDVSDPSNPVSLELVDAHNHTRDLAVAGDRIFVAGQSSGVQVIDTFGCSSGCLADMASDGHLNFFDVIAFLNAFTDGDSAADFTGEGVLDFFDVSAFLIAFAAGCP